MDAEGIYIKCGMCTSFHVAGMCTVSQHSIFFCTRKRWRVDPPGGGGVDVPLRDLRRLDPHGELRRGDIHKFDQAGGRSRVQVASTAAGT